MGQLVGIYREQQDHNVWKTHNFLQIKTTTRYHLIPARMANITKSINNAGEGVEKREPSCTIQFHFSLSCIGEGNGNPLQCSCLENPRDGGAWWAAVYGVAQSWTRLTRLSSSNSSSRSSSSLHYCWECKLIQPLWRTACKFLKKLKVEL